MCTTIAGDAHMERKQQPIGFFDSGVGGLSVLRHAREMLPNENFIFYGDCGNVPYGEKTPEQVRTLTLAACDKLYEKGAKAILVACNTATSAAIHAMRDKYQIPIISMEPAIKPASESGNPGDILMMATPGTVSSARYGRLVERVGCRDRLINIPCGGLADLLEKGEFDGPEVESYIREILSPYAGREVCGIVIGCTHYSFVVDTIRRVAAELLKGACDIYDGMYGTVRQLQYVLEKEGTASDGPGGKVELFASGDPAHLEVMQKILDM